MSKLNPTVPSCHPIPLDNQTSEFTAIAANTMTGTAASAKPGRASFTMVLGLSALAAVTAAGTAGCGIAGDTDGARFALQGHRGWVNKVCFSPNGSVLATAGEDGSLRL